MKILSIILCLFVALLGGFLAFAYESGMLIIGKNIPVEVVSTTEEGDSLLNEQVELVDELMEALQKRMSDLDSRELQVEKREKDLKEREIVYEQLSEEVNNLMDQVEDELITIKDSEFENSKQLADVYAKMDPSSAANSLRGMSGNKAALILGQMDGREMAIIMEATVANFTDGGESVAEWSDTIQRLIDERGEL